MMKLYVTLTELKLYVTLTEIVLHLYFFYYSITSSGKEGKVSTLIIHVVAIVEAQ